MANAKIVICFPSSTAVPIGQIIGQNTSCIGYKL